MATQQSPRSRSARFSTPAAHLPAVDDPAFRWEVHTPPWGRPSPVIVQHRAKAVERARATETIFRVGALVLLDLVVLGGAHALVNTARSARILARLPATLLAELLPRGTFPRAEVLVAIILGLAIFGTYRTGGRWHKADRIFAGSTLGLSLVFWSRLWNGVELATILGFVILIIAVGIALVAGRAVMRECVRRGRHNPGAISRAIIIGPKERATHLKHSEGFHSDARLEIVGYLTPDRKHDGESLGALSDLVWVIERHDIDSLIIDGHIDDEALVDVLEIADRLGCRVIAGSPALPVGGFVPRVSMRHHVPYVEIVRPRLRWAQLFSKRAFDIVAASVLLALFAPVFLVVAVLVKLTSRGPVFFTSLRVGYAGRHFPMYKFRSMVLNAEDLRDSLKAESVYNDPRVFKVMNDPRVTPLGRFLRRSSLDELPQLWNVLRGEMSLVGPRPPLAREVVAYEENNYSRFDMKPGITGPWQVSGRSGITSFDHIIALETAYLTDWSLGRDLAILLRTVPAVLSMRGAV